MKQKISITMDEKILRDIDSLIDNLLIRNRSQAIEYLVKSSLGGHRTAVILAGGDERELELAPGAYSPTANMGKATVAEKAVAKLRENGFKEIYYIARHKILTQAFNILKDGSGHGVKMHYIEEKSSSGTASTLRLVKGKLRTGFLAVYGDILFDKVNIEELWSQHARSNSIATIMLTTSAKPEEKGTVKMEGNKVLEFVQKPKRSDIHLVFSPIIAASEELLDQQGASLEYDVFPKLAAKGLLQGHVSSEKEIHLHSIEDLNRIKK